MSAFHYTTDWKAERGMLFIVKISGFFDIHKRNRAWLWFKHTKHVLFYSWWCPQYVFYLHYVLWSSTCVFFYVISSYKLIRFRKYSSFIVFFVISFLVMHLVCGSHDLFWVWRTSGESSESRYIKKNVNNDRSVWKQAEQASSWMCILSL